MKNYNQRIHSNITENNQNGTGGKRHITLIICYWSKKVKTLMNKALTNLSDGENDMCSSLASPSKPRLLQLLLFPLVLGRKHTVTDGSETHPNVAPNSYNHG